MRKTLAISLFAMFALSLFAAGSEAQTFSCVVWGKTDLQGSVTVGGAGVLKEVPIDAAIGEYKVDFSDRIPNCEGFTFSAIGDGAEGSGVYHAPSLRIDLIKEEAVPEPAPEPEVTCGEGTHEVDGQCVADEQPAEGTTSDEVFYIGGTGVTIGAAVIYLLGLRKKKSEKGDFEKIIDEMAKKVKPRTAVKITFFPDSTGKVVPKIVHLHPGVASYNDPALKHRKKYHEDGEVFVRKDE